MHLLYRARCRILACACSWLTGYTVHAGQTFYLSAFPTARAAFDAAANGNTLVVDVDRAADTATGTLKGAWNDLTIRGTNGHRISGSVVFAGQAVQTGPDVYANRDNVWLPIGTTNLVLSPAPPLNRLLVMETTREAAYKNQCGVDFLTAVRVEKNAVTLDADLVRPGLQGLATLFFNPRVHTCEGRQSAQTLARGTTRLTGPEWATLFKKGDIARFENVDGTDSVDGDRHYFENAEILSADADGLSFEPLASAFGTPFVVKTAFGHNLTIEHAAFESLTIASYENVTLRSLKTERVLLINCYRFDVRDVEAVTSQNFSVLAGFTFCKIGRVENIRASGGRSSADNANIKFMSPVRVSAARLSSLESAGFRSDQAMCGIFQDYCYSPYVTWASDDRFESLTARKPSGGAPIAIWFTGLRDSTITDTDAGDGDVRFHKTSHVRLSGPHNRCGRITDFFETRDSSFDFGTSAYVRIVACQRSAYSGAVTGGDGALQCDGRAVWVGGNSKDLLLDGLHSSCTNGSPFIWLQDVESIRVANCADPARAPTAWSLHCGNNVTGLTLSNNTFRARH